ncbi:MAG: DUF222 domain-containing protein [Propionicimonas sp.]|uniref:HNH endonuclease signature motif containing protein n=1 Tax=Propionicimonas sp. TaxID=1955623 RepID=UPI003D0B3D62
MEANGTLMPAGDALAEIERVLDSIEPNRAETGSADRLAWVRTARRVRGRIDALCAVLTAEADRAKASEHAAGTPLVSWLGMGETLSRAEASGAVHQARTLARHPLVGEAAVAGRIGTGQARAIAGVLDDLAPELDAAQSERAEQVMVDLASHLDAAQLTRSAGRVLQEVAPVAAGELLEVKLQREAERAHRERSLRFFREGGSVRFDGSLPRIAAERWIAQLDACAEQARRTAMERRDPLAETTTPAQRKADALIQLIERGAPRGGAGPAAGAVAQAPSAASREPRPADARVIVQLDYEALQRSAAGAGLLGSGEQLSAGELRRLCCDAEIVPVVLGSASEVLDVGRAERLVTPALRTALVARDGGCVFPGCDATPSVCEAHHIVPWWAGGRTALSNLVLLCHSHHPVVEPARHAVRDQWQVHIADDELPEFVPPARLDPRRRPLRHARHGPARAAP